MSLISINPNIKQAATLPATFYKDPQIFERVKEQIFSRSWHWVADADVLPENGSVYPFTLLPGVLDEPLVLTRDAQRPNDGLTGVDRDVGEALVAFRRRLLQP